ncbi:MAG TPA: M15 family metallopeptidase [Alphaproteobacteria bacterium]|nr:M15 family metallopeptidase [Alphaproteobacteria bacterium]
MKKLQGSVGRGGRNHRKDVLAVQRLLRLKRFDLGLEDIDGKFGNKTRSAIEKFQKSIKQPPNGLIEPGGATWNSLVSAKGAQALVNLAKWEGDPFAWPQDKKLRSMHPHFRQKVEVVMRALKKQGWQPTIHNAWRSLARQAKLKAGGFSDVSFGYHNVQLPDGAPYAYAADIVDRRYLWNDSKKETLMFFNALGAEAKRQGLYWGGDFGDWAHVQFLPNGQLQRIRKIRRP